MQLHEKIKQLWKASCLEQKELAYLVGISQSEISKIVNGRLKHIPTVHIKKFEEVFKVSLRDYYAPSAHEFTIPKGYILVAMPTCDEEAEMLKHYRESLTEPELTGKRKVSTKLTDRLILLEESSRRKNFYVNSEEFKAWLNAEAKQ